MESETENTNRYEQYAARLQALGVQGPMPVGNTGDFTYGLYRLGLYGRPVILQHDNASCTPWVPITDSNRVDDTLIRLSAYAEGDKLVLLKSALENVQQASILQEIAELLNEYDRKPMASARFVRQVRDIIGRGRKTAVGQSRG